MTVAGPRAGWRLSYVEFLRPVHRLLCGRCPNLALTDRTRPRGHWVGNRRVTRRARRSLESSAATDPDDPKQNYVHSAVVISRTLTNLSASTVMQKHSAMRFA